MNRREKTLKYLADTGVDVTSEHALSKILYLSQAGLTDEEICRVMLAGDGKDELKVLDEVRRRLLGDVHAAQAKLRKLDCCIAAIKRK